jgi:hypothetical protein
MSIVMVSDLTTQVTPPARPFFYDAAASTQPKSADRKKRSADFSSLDFLEVVIHFISNPIIYSRHQIIN